MSMGIPLPKLKAILLYFCSNTDQKFLGKVKLMKLFYFLDFGHVKKYGTPITYDTYVNLEHGPIPTTIKNLIDEACDDIDSSILADTISCEASDNSKLIRIIPKRSFTEKDRGYFSESELQILYDVCTRFNTSNTRTIEEISHREAPWKTTRLLDRIPYTLAAGDGDCQTSKEDIELLAEIYK